MLRAELTEELNLLRRRTSWQCLDLDFLTSAIDRIRCSPGGRRRIPAGTCDDAGSLEGVCEVALANWKLDYRADEVPIVIVIVIVWRC